MYQPESSSLLLNIAPASFSKDRIEAGRIAYIDEDTYTRLREDNWRTHVFRFDKRTKDILNVSVVPGIMPIGLIEQIEIKDHLLLLAKAVQQSTLIWLANSLSNLKAGKQLMFWGQADTALLLSQAALKSEVQPVQGLEVVVRFEIDCRMFSDPGDNPFLGLVIDVGASNVIDISVADLIQKGLVVIDRYVCRRKDVDHPYLHPGLELVGRVTEVHGSTLLLTDTEGISEIDATEALLEPRLENLHDVIKMNYGVKSGAVLSSLKSLRQPLATSMGKLDRVRSTLAGLKKRRIIIGNDVEVTFGDLLQSDSPKFPARIATDRPTMLFGPQGRNTGLYPDPGISTHGPYMFMQHTKNSPVIGVICEARLSGRVGQFLRSLESGFQDELWTNTKSANPYKGGLIGKFRLAKIKYIYEECDSPTPESYKNAIRKLLQKLPQAPDLVIVQTREEFKLLRGDRNPYYVTKSELMKAGIPVQSIFIERIDSGAAQLPYILNNVAVATYAKLDGIPWIISTRGTTAHEIVVGLGSVEVSRGRLQVKARYVGVTTVFQGDGRYIVWGLTREVVFEEYITALLESLRTTIAYVKEQNNWQAGDKVRLICHVYKRLRDCEADAIKSLIRELVADKYVVEFAFLDISWSHPYQIFDPAEKGKSYWTEGVKRIKGKGVPTRGICLQLDKSRGLLHLTGPGDIKTEEQGLPQPLLVELHSESTFTDLTYLLRQIYHFSYMSWQSFFPSTEPVTIKYSRLIARMLGNLNLISDWDSTALSVGNLRGRRWFL
jgi:hypothetical protein